MNWVKYFKIFIVISCWTNDVKCVDRGYFSDGNIAQLLYAKDYLPEDLDLPKPSDVIRNENEATSTYLLSKLSDDELIKLLQKFPKTNEDAMNDIMKVTEDLRIDQRQDLKHVNKFSANIDEPQSPVFRLENKEVDPYIISKDADPKFNAHQKLSNMLYSRPQEDISEENYEKKEMLFDVLVDQLKTLCCKKRQPHKVKPLKNKQVKKPTEYIFLVMNDEIKSNKSDELISVDPDSLADNSSVLLLGPITIPMTDLQTKLVTSRITKELSKPEYLPLLQKISEGNIGKKNSDLMKSWISGPDTRRYIKPHRCNHQSKLAKIYGGTKWLICTGYLNLNTPSLYD